MRAILKSMSYLPEPSSLSGEPAKFSFLAQMLCGPEGEIGEESFSVTVCTPESLATTCRSQGGILDVRNCLVVDHEMFDQRRLRVWLEQRVAAVTGATWHDVARELNQFAHWEFEGYPR